MTQVDVSPLFQPFSCKSLHLKNRIVMAPMTRQFSPGYVPNDDVVAYYRRRAENDVGLIITEGTTVNHPSANGYENVPAFHGEALKGWKKVVDAVHAAGGKIMPQLWHVGTVRKPGIGPDKEAPGIGPSGITSAGKRKAHVMSLEDIQACVAAFAQAAADAEQLGFDGVEIHGAHGYLIDQFFWDVTNERTDRYGGSLENRLQFAIEIIEAVRARVSASFPVVLRYSQWKQQDYSARLAQTPDELERFLKPLAAAGVDIFHCSNRRFWEPEFPGSSLNLAGWTKEITGLPTISVGSVGLEGDFLDTTFSGKDDGKPVPTRRFDELFTRLQQGEFDLIAVGRALLQDPEWAVKVRQGRFSELKPYSKTAETHLY
ncbi:MAG: NADH:flavin oxidoreductase, partial [Pseudomonadota bacterium]